VTSEHRHSIRPQPKDTCPLLDAAITEVENVEYYSNKAINLLGLDIEDRTQKDLEDALQALSYIAECVRDCKAAIEEARENVVAIREWGQDWKEKGLEWFEENEKLEDEVSTWKIECEYAQEQLAEVNETLGA